MDCPPQRVATDQSEVELVIQWVKELEQKLDKPPEECYKRIRRLKEDGFQGNVRINFNAGRISSINFYETISL